MEIFAPISLGELYDKISILEIKLDKIIDENKRLNVSNELNKLQEISEKYPIKVDLYIRLKQINMYLWEIEDNIRIKEKEQKFDSYFVHYARSVYKLNDERAIIKREINEQYGSQIIEEKSYEKY